MTNLERWQLFMRDVESPDIYIIWGFYHMISSALQRRVWLYSDPNDLLPCSFSLFPNDFPILVGPPATGKGRVIAQEASLIKAPELDRPGPTGEKLALIPCSPDKITLEALARHIAQSIKSLTRKHPLNPTKNQAYAYCPCCFLIEELEVLFSQNTNDMVAALVHCYDGHDMHYKTKHQGEDKIKNVCVSMIAGTTPDSVRELMNNKIIKKGMASRCIFIYADKPRFYRDFPGLSPEQMQARKELVTHLKNLTTLFGEVKMTPDAQEWQKRFYESGEMAEDRLNKDPRLDDYYGRKRLHWLKLAITMACADTHQNPVITLETLKKAYDLLKITEVRMHEAFGVGGRNFLYEVCIDIQAYLKNKGPTPHRKLWWDFAKETNKQQFDEVIDLLIGTGKIRLNGGIYSLVSHEPPTEGILNLTSTASDEPTTSTTTIIATPTNEQPPQSLHVSNSPTTGTPD